MYRLGGSNRLASDRLGGAILSPVAACKIICHGTIVGRSDHLQLPKIMAVVWKIDGTGKQVGDMVCRLL